MCRDRSAIESRQRRDTKRFKQLEYKKGVLRVDTEFQGVAEEFREFNEKMKDPLVVGALLNKIAQERQSTNLLFKNLLEKIESLEAKVDSLESKLEAKSARKGTALSATDEKIVKFVRSRERTCAEELQKEFGYKGRNAASSRLNTLFKQGLLEKVYAGKTVYFRKKESQLI